MTAKVNLKAIFMVIVGIDHEVKKSMEFSGH
jgi:hypothetical protein